MSRLVSKKMTLLETLLGLLFLSVLLSFVFSFVVQLMFLQTATEEKENEGFMVRYLESRFGFLCARLVHENEPNRTFFFYTEPASDFSESASLIFTFDNGVRRDPNFSGDLLGRLCVDRDHRLVLFTWPLKHTEIGSGMHQEVLLEGVQSLHYFFYTPPPRLSNAGAVQPTKGKGTSSELHQEPERDQWTEDVWLLGYKQMPALLRLEIEHQKGAHLPIERFVLQFVLPASKNAIQYPGL